ncbi:MAG: SMP-30/gluconolactonase/LRE family protein [Acidimicrobiia bacterium]
MGTPAEVRDIATGLEFPEGPIVMPDGSVLVVEIRRGTLSRAGTDGKVDVVADLGGGPNGAAIGPDGACYIANNGGFLWSELDGMLIPFDLKTMSNQPVDFTGGWINRVDLETGEHSVLYKECDGFAFRGPNDIVFDTDGGFWFTDFGKSRAHDTDRGGLYYGTVDGKSVVQVARGLLGPNGVGLSPAGDRVYVAESYTGRLNAWDVTGPGKVKSPMATVVEATKGHFDSLAVEADGAVVVAAIGEGLCVVQADGTGHENVALPDRFTTNVCFGGGDMRTAYATLSGMGRLVALDWPRPGLKLAF